MRSLYPHTDRFATNRIDGVRVFYKVCGPQTTHERSCSCRPGLSSTVAWERYDGWNKYSASHLCSEAMPSNPSRLPWV